MMNKNLDPPSPINVNRNNIPDDALKNDDSIIFDDFVEAPSFMSNIGKGGPIMQESSFIADMNKSSFLKPLSQPPPTQPPPNLPLLS